MSEQRHYHLVHGSVTVKMTDPETKELRQATQNMSIIATTSDGRFNRDMFARAEQALRLRFIREYDPENRFEIVDITTQYITPLGLMTEKEFHGSQYVEPKKETETPAND